MNKSSQPSHFYYGYIITICSFAILAVNIGAFLSFGVFFKPILNDFGWSRAVTSGPISLSIIISGFLGIVLGGFTDKFGPRLVMIVCGTISGIGFLLMYGLSNVWELYIYYGVLTATGISILVPITSTIARWFVKNRTLMTGVVVAAGGVGGLVLPLASNWLISNYNWRISYIILGILVIAVNVIAGLFLKRNPPVPDDSQPFGKTPDPHLQGYALRESILTSYYWILAGAFFCFNFTSGILQIHIVPHVTDINFSPATAAFILSIMNAFNIIGSILLGSIADRVGNRPLFIVTLLMAAISVCWLIFIQQLWMLYAFGILFGLAWGSACAQQSPLVAATFGMKAHGLVLGTMSFINTIGISLGTFLAGYVFDVAGSYNIIFIIAGTLCCIGLLLMVFLKPIRAVTKTKALSSD